MSIHFFLAKLGSFIVGFPHCCVSAATSNIHTIHPFCLHEMTPKKRHLGSSALSSGQEPSMLDYACISLKKWSNSNSSGDLLKSLRFLFLRHGPSSIGFYMFFPHPYYLYPNRPAKMSFWGRGLDLSSMRYGISMRYSYGGWTCNSAVKKRCPPVLKRVKLRVSPCVIFLGDGCYFVPSWSQRVLLDITTWAHHENPPQPSCEFDMIWPEMGYTWEPAIWLRKWW